jgi:hypothetical protein
LWKSGFGPHTAGPQGEAINPPVGWGSQVDFERGSGVFPAANTMMMTME